MLDRQKAMSQNLAAALLELAMFMGTTVLIGFGQAANSSGADTYKTNCVACHAADGRGSAVGKSLRAPDLHSAQVQQESNSQLADVITNGKGNMPSFAGRLSNDQINGLVKYLRNFRKVK